MIMYTWAALKGQCEISHDIVDNYRAMFESRISAVRTEKLPYSENFRISSWSYDMEGHAKKCVERYCELANKTTHHFKEEELKSVGELSKVCSQIVLKCLYLARIGRPNILWSVNKLARSITKCTRACDKRLNRLISYIHHTCECNKMQAGTVSRLRFCGRSSRLKIYFRRNIVRFWKSYICSNKLDVQTSVSHSSTQSEIISLDAGLRLDGIPALDLWDLIVLVLGNTTQNHHRTEKPVVCRDENHVRHQSRGVINVLDNVDFVPSDVRFSHREALLYVFEDNEAVIKMIFKGRSPTMRHVSRTHRVALHWLFDRINLDPKIQIKCIDPKNQLADMLTKGNFTRDEWNHLLCLSDISHFSSAECSEVMSKRTQKESGEERVTAKSRPMMTLIARDPSTLSSSASESPGKRSYESQSPLSAQAEKYDRTETPVVGRDTGHAPEH